MPHHVVEATRSFSGPALPAAQACQHDDAPALVQALATAHLSPNLVGKQGMTLLLLAMSNRSKQAMRALLKLGADPNLRTPFGLGRVPIQPVALAAGGEDIEILRLLLDHGGDPNSHYGDEPATFRAALGDRYDQVRLLLERGADIDATDKDDRTLMLVMADRRQYDQAAYLIKRGGSVSKANEGGNMAFDVQSDVPDFMPTDSMYRSLVEVKQLLEMHGVKFPVPHPGIAFQARVRKENAQRRVWEATTPAGQHWAALMHQDDLSTGHPKQDFDHRVQAEAAFQVWRKTQPEWSKSTTGGDIPLYSSPPTLEEEAAEVQRQKAALAAESDSAKREAALNMKF